MTTGHPVIMLVILVAKVKNTAIPASISGKVEVNEKEFAANVMTGELTGQSYSEKTDWPNKVIEFRDYSRIFTSKIIKF